MNPVEIEAAVSELALLPFDSDEFPFAFLAAFGNKFNFKRVDYQSVSLVLLEIPAATSSPVEFDRQAFIRIGSATPRLSDHPERLKALWAKLQPYVWETGIASTFLSGDEVLRRLD